MATPARPHDLVIRGGRIVDGTGAPGRRGDLAVREGRVAAIGTVPGRGVREISAAGPVVAPGFLAPHTHYDAQINGEPVIQDGRQPEASDRRGPRRLLRAS